MSEPEMAFGSNEYAARDLTITSLLYKSYSARPAEDPLSARCMGRVPGLDGHGEQFDQSVQLVGMLQQAPGGIGRIVRAARA